MIFSAAKTAISITLAPKQIRINHRSARYLHGDTRRGFFPSHSSSVTSRRRWECQPCSKHQTQRQVHTWASIMVSIQRLMKETSLHRIVSLLSNEKRAVYTQIAEELCDKHILRSLKIGTDFKPAALSSWLEGERTWLTHKTWPDWLIWGHGDRS